MFKFEKEKNKEQTYRYIRKVKYIYYYIYILSILSHKSTFPFSGKVGKSRKVDFKKALIHMLRASDFFCCSYATCEK